MSRQETYSLTGTQRWDAIVIGGGCAGMSCATKLAAGGKKVLVLEKRNILGGRACSYLDPQTGETLDNGQHLLLGCYVETIEFLKRIGQEKFLAFNAGFETEMVGPGNSKSYLRSYPLPAPFHILVGLLKYDALSWKDRWSIVVAAAKMRKDDPKLRDMSCTTWLEALKQSRDTREKFWDLVILATINVHPDIAPANLLQVVMKQGFLSSKKASRVGLSTVGLSDLYANPSKTFIEDLGGEVRINQTVDEILMMDGKVLGVRLHDNQLIEASSIICTVPPSALTKIKMADSNLQSTIEKTSTLKSSPIVSFHFWADLPPMDNAYIGFWGTEFHWAFQKSKVYGDEKTKHWTLVASGADEMLNKNRVQLLATAKKDLGILPEFRNINIKRAKAVFEREATWVPPIKDVSGRLPTKTPVSGLFMAGDWTDTGLPCTIESAVLSGHRAALEIL